MIEWAQLSKDKHSRIESEREGGGEEKDGEMRAEESRGEG